MNVTFKTANGKSFKCDMPIIPRKGESIVVSEMGEIYTDNDDGSPDWEVRDVHYHVENGIYLGVIVYIENC